MTSKEKIEKAWELVNNKHLETNKEIQLVRYAVRRAYELEERVTPMLPLIFKDRIHCPKCRSYVLPPYEFCGDCGQRLDWSALNEN